MAQCHRFWHAMFFCSQTCKTHCHPSIAHNNQPCRFLIQRNFVIGKVTQLSVNKKDAWWLGSITLKIMVLLKHNVSIRKSTGDIRRCNWFCCLLVLCQMCRSFTLTDLVYCSLLPMSFFHMSLKYVSRAWLWLLILYLAMHLICAMTFGENQKGKDKCHFQVA